MHAQCWRDRDGDVSVGTAVALVLALASTTLTNVAYLREHDAAAALPVLSMRRPLHSARLLLDDRSWMLGFAMVIATHDPGVARRADRTLEIRDGLLGVAEEA